MSKENELNKTLSEIYTDLEGLQSAREQVEMVTKSSEDLTNSTSMLLQELREFSNQFGEENTSTFSQLTQSLDSFEGKINSISEKGNESISGYIKSFKKQIVIVIDQFSKQISENEKNLTAINSLNNEKIGEKIKQFEKTTKDLKVNAEQGIENIKSIAIAKIEKQEKEISKTILHIAETNSKTESLIKIITNYVSAGEVLSTIQREYRRYR
jgi:primosomal protein N'